MEETNNFGKSLRVLAKSSFIFFIGIFLSKIFTYLYQIIVAREFGPEMFGIVALSLTIVSWPRVIASLGITDALLRYISFYRGKKTKGVIRHLINISLIIIFSSSTLITLALFFSADYIALQIFKNESLAVFIKIFSFIIPIMLLNGILLTIIKAYEKISWLILIEYFLGNSVKIGFLLSFIYLGFNAFSIPYSHIFGLLTILMVSYYIVLKKLNPLITKGKSKINKRITKEFITYALPMLLFSITFSAFSSIDVFFIGIFRDVVNVGFYNAAMPISLLILISKDIFTQLFFPIITKEYAKGNIETIKKLSQQIGKWIFLVSSPILIIFIIFPELIILLIFGKEYLSAANALRILSIGAFFTANFETNRDLLLMRGKSTLTLINVIIVLLINIVLNIVLVPSYGIIGAATATTLSLIILNMAYVFQSWFYTRITTFKKSILSISIIPIILCTIFYFLSSALSQNNVIDSLLIILFILSYIFLILITGSFDKEDKIVIDAIKNKIKRYVKL